MTNDHHTKIRERRIIARIPVRVLAGRANVSAGYLSEFERGVREVTEERLHRITAALDELAAARSRVKALADSLGVPL